MRADLSPRIGPPLVLALACVSLCLFGPRALGAGDPGPTPAEELHFRCSPNAEETAAYLEAVDSLSVPVRLDTIGWTAEGRPIRSVYIRGGDAGEPRPVVLVTACIHAGEICGKDALLLLLRDIVRGAEQEAVSGAEIHLVPIFNVDGHERRSAHNRFTQAGPECGGGTRRNALRLDMNRDYAKLESPECRALVAYAAKIRPHVYVDLHTDDGIGHQYDLLFQLGVNPTHPEGRGRFAGRVLQPYLVEAMEKVGFRAHPIAYPLDRSDLSRGLATYGISARVGTGYFEGVQAFSILVEANPYVPYERRVRATDAFVRSLLRFVGEEGGAIRRLVEDAREEAVRWAREEGGREIALSCRADLDLPVTIPWLGKRYEMIESEVTGERYALYGDRDTTLHVPFFPELKPAVTATMPAGYLIERAWNKAALRLSEDHKVHVQTLSESLAVEVDAFRVTHAGFSEEPYQGRHPLRRLEGEWETVRRTFPPGTFWVPLDQPGVFTIMNLLEPRSPDALLVWNAFDSVVERGIILERWALEKNAGEMLDDPEVRRAYEEALLDSVFAADASARLEFFFQRTPFTDEEEGLYPVFRLSGPIPFGGKSK